MNKITKPSSIWFNFLNSIKVYIFKTTGYVFEYFNDLGQVLKGIKIGSIDVSYVQKSS
ncbi:hypothetical protein VCRA2122O12_50228 [Vibrio crassostreae]|nr:hypothetical protein VCRA2114E5_50007 [Vibrio crassostreae]CAK2091602.1 hypothetical protein VCRA2110O4_50007 [Vibrio crassostreae]CAK2120026.1 hypothetical protein VCRA2110O1_50228 [Vibrio crassostreae]CAK2874612.1 hypothetical protein VCRA2110O3_50007 [Vibrio crassostreae]CAK2989029.1 hypothetical protein VCRA2122O10_50228 [Vibrio crassostreae]